VFFVVVGGESWRGDHGVGVGVGALERGGGDFVGYATRRRGKEAKREGKGKKGKKGKRKDGEFGEELKVQEEMGRRRGACTK